MTSARATDRVQLLLATARKNPEFAHRLLLELPEAVRGELLAALAQPAQTKPGPGLRKCKPAPSAHRESNGLSAQLNLFAKQVARVS